MVDRDGPQNRWETRIGSNPITNSNKFKMGVYTVGIAGKTVDLLSSGSGGLTPSAPTFVFELYYFECLLSGLNRYIKSAE